ncbi:MAG TPA: ThuA domain-containing protein [Polyangiaceae bacterium]|nr:ThuA domain-containing protein [Polyangiaceae bacterium]
MRSLGFMMSVALVGCTSASPMPSGAGGKAAGSGATAGALGTGAGGVTGGNGGGQSGASGGVVSDAASDSAPAEGGDSGLPVRDAAAPALPPRVLLYHFSTLDIPSVPAQISFFQGQLAQWDYASDESVDPAQLSDQNLEHYAAVAMINTCFEPFGKGQPDQPQSGVLQRFLQRGGGLFGTHCASVTFQSATPPVLYNQLIGGRGGNGFFDGTSACRVLAQHPTTAGLNANFSFLGNLDNTDFLAPDSVVLVKCSWQTMGGKDVAVSWYRSEGQGRVFYTDFAKVDTDLKAPGLGAHIVAGLAWVLNAAI